MEGHRIKRVETSYYEILSRLLISHVKDPLLTHVRISQVRLTPDLKIARIYFYLVEEKQAFQKVLGGLKRSKGFFKKKLAEGISLRFIPELEFFYDDSIKDQQHLEELFEQIHQEHKR